MRYGKWTNQKFFLIFLYIGSNTKMYMKGEIRMKKEDKAPNVSGSFQIVNDQQKEDVKNFKDEQDVDEESFNFARQFMED